jgi:hypothetical protein
VRDDFSRPWWSEQEHILPLQDEAGRGELVDQRAVHLLVEIEIEGVEGAIRIAEASLLNPTRDQPVLPARQLVADEGGHEIDGRLPLGVGLTQAGIERGGHAREPKLAERGVEFDEIHERSPVC